MVYACTDCTALDCHKMKGSQAVIVHAAHDLRCKERNTRPLNYYNALNAMCMMEQYLVERNLKNYIGIEP